MGSGTSSQVVKYVEVSFINPKTGKIFPEEKINRINNKIFKEFDYKPSYYDAYKRDKDGNNPYKKYAEILENK